MEGGVRGGSVGGAMEEELTEGRSAGEDFTSG